jgi:hypothetical protein
MFIADFAAKVALDRIVASIVFADLQDFGVGQIARGGVID